MERNCKNCKSWNLSVDPNHKPQCRRFPPNATNILVEGEG